MEVMKNTTARATIEVLRKWFAKFGIPMQLVSDNGPQFISNEFEQFMGMNGVKHIRCSAHHPCSNGGAERFVQTMKRGLSAYHIETGDSCRKLAF